MDSFHECLQEYGEGLEVVQICLEPEEVSIKDDEISAFGDLSLDDCKKDELHKVSKENVNGIAELKCSKSDESLDDQEDDMTITEDDVLTAPRELNIRSKSSDRNDLERDRSLSKQQSKDISTSDEMVFAVTPTGLERISFDKYWKEGDDLKVHKSRLEKVISDESWKECLNSPIVDTVGFDDAIMRISVQEENNSLLYIDHEVDGYETCLDEDSSSVKYVKNARKTNNDHIKDRSKHDKTFRNRDNDVSAKSNAQNTANSVEDVSSSYPYVQEHIIKQMKSLRIEPLNVNIGHKKMKKKSPTKPSKSKHDRRQCVEYYNDQAECLKEIRQQKLDEEEKKHKEEQKKMLNNNLATIEKKLQLKKQQPSEESTDLETNYVPGCHKCFLENYAYAITKAYIAEATACKYCEVIRDMLEAPKMMPDRRMSAPALVNLESSVSETDDEDLLMVPVSKDRRKSAGPLKFLVPSRRASYVPQSAMTVTVSPDRRETAQRWGSPRAVHLKRSPGAPLGVSIVGGKVDIISNRDDEDGEEKAIFGIFIKNVVPDSPAGNCGELQTGDRILEVDGVCVRSAQHDRVVQLIKAAGDKVTLTVQSLVAWNTDSSDVDASPPAVSPAQSVKKTPAPSPVPDKTPRHDIKITVSEPDIENEKEIVAGAEKDIDNEIEEPPAPKPDYSDSDSSDEEDERELGGRTYSEKGVEIDRASAGAIKRSKEEKEADPEAEDDFGYTTNKIRKKYSSLGDSVVAVKLERSPKGGLGLSLAGHRDRSRMAVFVCGMHPAGAAAKASPTVKVGDEILEVNGIVLHGRCHLNASAIIKGLIGPVFKIILLRRKSALEDVAVKPLTQFPVALEEESEDRFAGYKGVRDITIKKGPSGLGIMIIEGRHTEAGRGIFVSDLQEGSAAEQAGLQIGDMILAVNRDSLLSCSYDAAAAKLKQTEGVVVLTVCSPNMKDKEDGTPAGGSATSRPASRNQTPDPGLASRPHTPRPVPSPVKVEPPPDPATAAIVPNQEMVIEINSANDVLGVVLLGGSDTLINGASAIILDIYKSGAVGKDGRLQVGDQVRECNGIAITKEMAHERLCMSIKTRAPKLRMTVFRPSPLQYAEVDAELSRKAGRALGLTAVQRAAPAAPHAYLGDLIPGSPVDLDGRLQKGDFIVSVDGKDLWEADYMTIATALKLTGNKVAIKVKRFKVVR